MRCYSIRPKACRTVAAAALRRRHTRLVEVIGDLHRAGVM
jgi:hypothetical protein